MLTGFPDHENVGTGGISDVIAQLNCNTITMILYLTNGAYSFA